MLNSFHIDGVKAFNEGNYELANAFLHQAIEVDSGVADSYFYLGKSYFFGGKTQQAISFLKKFIELQQHNSDDIANVSYAFDVLGQCYEADNKGTAALQCYQTATTIYPLGAPSWNNMGLLYIKSALHYLDIDLTNSKKFFRGAQHFIQKALAISSDNPLFLQSIASWYEHYINVLERVTDNETAVQENIASNFNYAIRYYRQAISVCHNHDIALKNIILSNLTECLAQYGHHWYKQNDYKKAQEIYLEALSFDSGHLIVINQLGMALFKQACFSEARQYFSSILEKTQDQQDIADAWLNIACTYRLEKEWEQAKEALSQAKNFAPDDLAIAEEDVLLNESKSAALLISAPQTLFGILKSKPQDTEQKIVKTPHLQPS